VQLDMPEDNKQVGKRFRDEGGVVGSAEDVAKVMEQQAPYAAKPGAMPIAAYFSIKGIDAILQASMMASTPIRLATVEDFDAIFKDH
jgi:hypothetical protein